MSEAGLRKIHRLRVNGVIEHSGQVRRINTTGRSCLPGAKIFPRDFPRRKVIQAQTTSACINSVGLDPLIRSWRFYGTCQALGKEEVPWSAS